MKITKIEQQKKDKTRYNIHLDGEYAFGLYDTSLLEFQICSGDDLEDSKLEEIKAFDEFLYGKRVAYNYLAYKPRTEKEVRSKLRLKKISELSTDKVITELQRQKFLDDDKYAKNYVEIKSQQKGMGRNMLFMKMMQKGLKKESIEETLKENFSNETEISSGVTLLRKYAKKNKLVTKDELRNKAFRYMFSRGYGFDVIETVMKYYLEEINE
ncbi:recombination regulator RecX [soil metagenome]